jgi:hypothetical protein
MAENIEAVDIVQSILAATFGPVTAAEVVKEEKGEEFPDLQVSLTTPPDEKRPVGSSSDEDDGSSGPTDRPHWWKKNLDGSWRKTCQAPDRTKGVAFGETKRHETDLSVLKALLAGAESLVEVVAATGYVKVTCVRSLERLVEAGRVVQAKAPPTGKRGRPAFIYRPTTEAA